MKAAIYTFPGYHTQGKQVADMLEFSSYEVAIHHFPDKESLVTLPEKKSDHVIFYLSLDYPNNKLIELLLACNTVRNQGVKRLTLVAPYLSYMRQDKSFHKVEAVSQVIIGHWLSELFDDVITVDPHLHRVKSLDDVIPNTRNIVLSATSLLGEFVKSFNKKVHLLGPDEESLQWVSQVAEISNSPYSVATKKRHGDTHVEIHLPENNFQDQHVILIDDVISTGNTVAQTAIKLYTNNAQQVDVIATHALFTKDAVDTLKNSNIKNIWSSDSITHPTNKISLNNLLAEKIKTLL